MRAVAASGSTRRAAVPLKPNSRIAGVTAMGANAKPRLPPTAKTLIPVDRWLPDTKLTYLVLSGWYAAIPSPRKQRRRALPHRRRRSRLRRPRVRSSPAQAGAATASA